MVVLLFLLFQTLCSRNNFDQLSGNHGLSLLVVGDCQVGKHITGVTSSVIHRCHTCAQFDGLVFNDRAKKKGLDIVLVQSSHDFFSPTVKFDLGKVVLVEEVLQWLESSGLSVERENGNEFVGDHSELFGVVVDDEVSNWLQIAELKRFLVQISSSQSESEAVFAEKTGSSLISNDNQFGVVGKNTLLEQSLDLSDDGTVD